MEKQPLVSVVMPAYNARDFIREAIDSVLAQTYGHIEIIVVNDGSTDETPQILEEYGNRIRVIHQENKGLSGARNTGILAAKGALVAFLDADDAWLPQKVERQVALFANDPELGFAYTGVSHFGPGAGKALQHIRPKLYRGNILKHLFCYPFITVSSAMVRKTCLDKVGIFDTRNPSTQDYDLWMRLAQRYRADFAPQPLVRYRVHASAMSRDRLFMLRWTLFVIEKQLRRTPQAFRDFPVRLFRSTRSLFLRALLLFVYRFTHHKDRKTARRMMRSYLKTYLLKLPAILLRKV